MYSMNESILACPGALEGMQQEIIQTGIFISIQWFIVYVLLGSLAKVCLIRFINKDLEPRSRRFWPVFLSQFLFFPILFVNFFTLMILENILGDLLIWPFLLIYFIVFFIVLPVMLDILFLRIIPRMKLFSWLLWTPPLKQVIIINVVICLVSYITIVLLPILLSVLRERPSF